jgi:quinoprotein glucose dehydrogenase
MNPLLLPARRTNGLFALSLILAVLCLSACGSPDKPGADNVLKQIDPAEAVKLARGIDSTVKPELAPGLSLSLWGIDSLVISPIGISVDNLGNLYYTTTDRQKNSEFDIRGHRDWEIESISLQTIEEKRAFFHRILSPENSDKNKWLKDLNGDSSHDWRDLTVEKESVYRVTDRNNDGVADETQRIIYDFNDEVNDVAGSVLRDGDDYYVAVAPDLWKMKDKNGDGIPDEKTSLSHGYGLHVGFGGHGMSGIEMGVDGRIYWQIGDIGFNGKGPDGQVWEHPNSGVVVRCNPDGSDFEVFSYGNRNTHEFVFDEYGNIISEDNDGDHPGEKERLVYIVNGADIGWRTNWQFGKYRDPDNNTYKVWMDEKMYLPRWDGQAAYITPCISNFVSGPAGMVYNPGTGISPEYKNSFFIAEFVGGPARSAIHNFRLNPKGASFELGDHKKILSGVLPTGIDFGPDGALYVADWIDGWNTHNYGRIWKLDDPTQAGSAIRKQVKELLAADFSSKKEADLGELLKHEDMRVRMKSQFELVKRGEKGAGELRNAIQQTRNQLARIHGIWGISQLARKESKYAETLLPLLKDGDQEIRAQAAKWLGDMRYAAAGPALVPLLKDSYPRAKFFAAEAIGRIKYEPAINAIIEMLKDNNDVDAYLRHAGCLALARIGKAEPVIALANNPSRALRIAAVVTLRRMKNVGIGNFLNDADEFVVTEAARGINDDLSIPAALPALGNLLNTTSYKNEPLIRRCISANLRVGSDVAMQNLVTYAQNTNAPDSMRAEAMDALSVWAKPSVLDRVDGRLRGVVERNAAPLKAMVTNPYIRLLKDKYVIVRVSAVKALSKLNITTASPDLMTALKNDKDAEVRSEALKALVAMKDAQSEQAIQIAIADKDKKVRVTGLDLLPKMPISKDLVAKLLSDVINSKTMEEKQAAMLSLGKLPAANTEKYFNTYLDQMATGKLSQDVLLELGEALDTTGAQALISKYKANTVKLSPDQLMASYASSLYGGDEKDGERIFLRNQSAQCMRCHSYNDFGANAAPRLNGVAKRLTREQILQSIINPSAMLANGYGFVSLTMKNGKTISGTVKDETGRSLVLKGDGGKDQVIEKANIAKRINAPSPMPDMKTLLSKKEIRDVVSFLSTLKEDK